MNNHLAVGTKYNLSGIKDWNLMPTEEIQHLIGNMMRIGMYEITDDNMQQVIKRSNKASDCNLQIPGWPYIRPITAEDIQKWKGFTSNIAYTSPQLWHSMMKIQFPHILDFARHKSKAESAGWSVVENGKTWLLQSVEDGTSVYVYPADKYLTETSVWQDAIMRGYVK